MLLLIYNNGQTVGLAQGTSDATATGVPIAAGTGTSAGVGAASGEGKPIAAGVGASSGVAAATGQGALIIAAAGAAGGTSEAEADGGAIGRPHVVPTGGAQLTRAGITIIRTDLLAA